MISSIDIDIQYHLIIINNTVFVNCNWVDTRWQ